LRSLNLIGGGRVGRTLARLWHASRTFQVQDVLTTSSASAAQAVEFIGAGRPVSALAEMRAADLWMLAVPDREIAVAAMQLAQAAQDRGMKPALAWHCSGALSSATLAPLRALGWPVASAHCILSFAAPASAVQQFAGTPCGLEGDAPVLQTLQASFTAIGAECFTVAAQDKMLYHAAAVFATNFLPVLQVLANDLWRDSGVPAAMLPRLSADLLRHAVENVMTLGPAAALTGPAARGDRALVQAQGEAVAHWDADAGDAYRALSRLALRIARDGGLPSS
jgi:predicted short-subunit dehydrogenase-like oxidoreductase (DUF2520 family)